MEHLSNDEKADIIAGKYGSNHICENCWQPYDSTGDCYRSAMEAMAWKDEQFAQEKQQLIDEAAEWIDNNVNRYIFENEYGETYIKYTFTEDFIKAMKGE